MRVQDLESQRLQKAAGFEDTLSAALEAYLEKFDPVKKARRALARKQSTENSKAKSDPNSGSNPNSNSNALRPVSLRVPVEQSSQQNFENLTTLCRAHHQMEHLKI
ncbi:MAG: hypothetical protein HY074_00800 [Deltaproteobacteria bacterium]|nr:hypothetical protein [Deltaproteobacteria bacterium]